MSDMERNKGKLIPVGKTVAEYAAEVVTEIPKYYDSKEDTLRNDEDKYGVVIINDVLYKVEFDVRRETDCPDFADVKVNEDGTIDFHTYHYNGGAHWTEVVEDGLK